MAECLAIEIAEYIERGLQWAEVRPKGRVTESPGAFLSVEGRTYRAGAVGLAFIGKAGSPQAALDEWLRVSNVSPSGRFEAAAGLLGVSDAMVRLVEANHRNGVPAAEIAASLRIGTLTLSFRTPAPVKTAAAGASAPASESPRQLLRESRVGTQQAGF